jgi:hypothetical protein
MLLLLLPRTLLLLLLLVQQTQLLPTLQRKKRWSQAVAMQTAADLAVLRCSGCILDLSLGCDWQHLRLQGRKMPATAWLAAAAMTLGQLLRHLTRGAPTAAGSSSSSSSWAS